MKRHSRDAVLTKKNSVMKSRKELIEFILIHIDKTHNENDKKDLLTFSDAELLEIYEDILDSNV